MASNQQQQVSRQTKSLDEMISCLKTLNKKYNVIYADPPWKYKQKKCNGAAENHYATMSLRQMMRVPISHIADTNCCLLLWCTSPMIPRAVKLMKHWGFNYCTFFFVWVKTKRSQPHVPVCGLGNWTRSSTEVCLLGVKGKPLRFRKSRSVAQVIMEPRRDHSRKPETARRRIIDFFGNHDNTKKIELFSRDPRNTEWDVWGLETEKYQSSSPPTSSSDERPDYEEEHH